MFTQIVAQQGFVEQLTVIEQKLSQRLGSVIDETVFPEILNALLGLRHEHRMRLSGYYGNTLHC